jgi:DNA-binding MarR family transcriptional regulator
MKPPKRGSAGQPLVPADYNDRLPYLFGAISNVLSSQASRLCQSAFGVGLAETRLIWVMNYEQALTVQRASQIMGIDKGATSRALSGLIRRGLARVTVDEADGRRRIMVFSAAGSKLRDRIMVATQEREHQLNSIFSEEELTTLRLLLNRFLAHARSMSTSDTKDVTRAETPSRQRHRLRPDAHSGRSSGTTRRGHRANQ